MRTRLSLVVLISLLSWTPSVALACFRLPEWRLDGYPRDGAEDVPLDVRPIYALSPYRDELGIPVTYRDAGLPDAGVVLDYPPRFLPEVKLSNPAGDVPMSVRMAQGTFFELVPDAPLAPNTLYTLIVRWKEAGTLPLSVSTPSSSPTSEKQGTLSFRTGDSVYAGDDSAPAVSATQFVGIIGTTDCDPPPRSVCFSLPDDEALYVTQFEGYPIASLVRGSSFDNRLSRSSPDQFECILIQRRAANGTLGEAARSCRGDWTVYDIEQLPEPDPLESRFMHCDSAGLHWGGQLLSERFAEARAMAEVDAGLASEEEKAEPEVERAQTRRDDGCSLAQSQRRPGEVLALLGIVVGLGLRRRRGSRGPSP